MALKKSVSFVCQSGRLEAQGVLLAASLRHHHPTLALYAAVPDTLSTAAQSALHALAVQCVPVTNPVADDYPIGHKVAALGAGGAEGLRLFLDSDILCLQPLPWHHLADCAFAAKAADVATFGSDNIWQTLYRRFGLVLPTQRVAATVSGALMYPYFNAGMVATTQAQRLSVAWATLCRDINDMTDVEPRRPWLDQIALPLALARLGLGFRALGERWNYPGHVKPLCNNPWLVHYHVVGAVRREPALRRCVADLLVAYPLLRPVLEADAAWAPVLATLRARRRWWRTVKPGRWHDLVVTGIPRSGTSYLCRLLDGLSNTAVINEPQELFEALCYGPDPWVVPVLHSELRARIDAGEAVENKMDSQGRLTEDTAVEEERVAMHPRVKRGSAWVLATKNTLAYMARLEGIVRLMPEARIVACIRNPVDTLASWKGTFAHLAQGDAGDVPVGGLADPFLPERLRSGLTALAELPGAAMRRAGWWRLLAEELWRWRGQITVVRYEDLVTHPSTSLDQLLGPFRSNAGRPPTRPRPSAVRSQRRRSLDAADWVALESLCFDVAARWGYDFSSAYENSGSS